MSNWLKKRLKAMSETLWNLVKEVAQTNKDIFRYIWDGTTRKVNFDDKLLESLLRVLSMFFGVLGAWTMTISWWIMHLIEYFFEQFLKLCHLLYPLFVSFYLNSYEIYLRIRLYIYKWYLRLLLSIYKKYLYIRLYCDFITLFYLFSYTVQCWGIIFKFMIEEISIKIIDFYNVYYRQIYLVIFIIVWYCLCYPPIIEMND